MSKSVLISIHPKYCELIASGKKTVEIRKTKPKLETPFKCFIYMTKEYSRGINSSFYFYKYGKVIGEFVCDEIYDIGYSPYNHGGFISNTDNLYEKSCLDLEKMFNYLSQGYGYGWHISDLVIYDEPKELSGFHKPCTDIKNCLNKAFRESGHSLNKCFDCNCRITRPPQSWCYVESEVEEK